MDEQPRPPVERREVIERHETVQRAGSGPAEPPPVRRGRSMAWLWVILLLLAVGALAWYALSRGEPDALDIPEVEAPDIEVPADEPDIEINVPDAGGGGEGGGGTGAANG
jgi:hypothetical protein